MEKPESGKTELVDNELPFIYTCCLYPSDYGFEKEAMIQLWVAQGLFPFSNREAEVEAAKMFASLSSRQFIVPSPRHFNYEANPSKIRFPYDKTHEYTTVLDSGQPDMMDDVPQTSVKHLCIDNKSSRQLNFNSASLKRFPQLQTLLFLSAAPGLPLERLLRDAFFTLTHLESLILRTSHISELPLSVLNLKSLRYLDLSYTCIRELPQEIISLGDLQTIRLKSCSSVRRLPDGIGKLTKLRHLVLDIIKQLQYIPPGIGNLTALQTMSAFIVGNNHYGCRIVELKNMTNLTGELWIVSMENVSHWEEARDANLMSKEFLRSLTLRWSIVAALSNDDATKRQEQILEYLQPPLGIEELRILSYGGLKLPSWIAHPSYQHLTLIAFQSCLNCCESLAPFGKLPRLKCLRIDGMHQLRRIDNKQLCGRDGDGMPTFPCLKELSLCEMPALQEWVGAQKGDFPCLETLEVRFCPKLVSLPVLSHLYSLKELIFYSCPNISSLPRNGQFATTLECLVITHCPKLKKIYDQVRGKDWRKIAHVRYISIE